MLYWNASDEAAVLALINNVGLLTHEEAMTAMNWPRCGEKHFADMMSELWQADKVRPFFNPVNEAVAYASVSSDASASSPSPKPAPS